LLSSYENRPNCDFFGRFCLLEPSELLHSLSKLCLFAFYFIISLVPSIAIVTNLSGDKHEKITRNMVRMDSDKWQIESYKRKKSFWMDRFEVTKKEIFLVIENNPSFLRGDGHPVEKVTWYDAKIFCE
jgi:hypothetical protein